MSSKLSKIALKGERKTNYALDTMYTADRVAIGEGMSLFYDPFLRDGETAVDYNLQLQLEERALEDDNRDCVVTDQARSVQLDERVQHGQLRVGQVGVAQGVVRGIASSLTGCHPSMRAAGTLCGSSIRHHCWRGS